MSNWDIAAKLGISAESVRKHLRRYLETDSHFPSNLSPEQVAERRATEIMFVEATRERLLARAHHLSNRKPHNVEEECKLALAEGKLSDSLIRISERICSITGVDAPKPHSALANEKERLDVWTTMWSRPLSDNSGEPKPPALPGPDPMLVPSQRDSPKVRELMQRKADVASGSPQPVNAVYNADGSLDLSFEP
jgi:hypothetical protein